MNCSVLPAVIALFAGLSGSFGQAVDTVYSPEGNIDEISEFRGDQIIRAARFKKTGEMAYAWDVEKKILESFDAISYEDTLIKYFQEKCPDHTRYQHYGNGPLMEIENYKDNARHGPYEKYYRDGKPMAKGRFAHWKKAGVWTYYSPDGNSDRHIHWFHHNYSEGGISIGYTIIPVAITMLAMVMLLILFIKISSFSAYFLAYGAATMGIYVLLMAAGWFIDPQAALSVREVIGNYIFPVLTTLIAGLWLLSWVALIFRKKTRVRLAYSILFMLVSAGLGWHLGYVYIMSRIAGAMVM